MSILLYRVLAASGGYVNGEEVAIGALVPLTIEEARYEVDSGAVEATGLAPNLPPAPTAIQPGDLVLTKRGIFERNVDVGALEVFLTRNGGVLAAFLATRADEIAGLAVAAAERQIGTKATPADIAAAIAPLATAIAGKATPANITAAVQPLVEALEGKATPADIASAVQPIAAALTGKATPADIASAIQPVSAALAGKATPADIATALGPVTDRVDDLQQDLNAARSVPGLWVYPGTGNGGAVLAPNQTVFPVPGGYTPGFVKVRIGLFYIDTFTATDGSTVVITGYTFTPSDVVTIELLKTGAVANAASKATVDALTARLDALAPDNSGWTAS